MNLLGVHSGCTHKSLYQLHPIGHMTQTNPWEVWPQPEVNNIDANKTASLHFCLSINPITEWFPLLFSRYAMGANPRNFSCQYQIQQRLCSLIPTAIYPWEQAVVAKRRGYKISRLLATYIISLLLSHSPGAERKRKNSLYKILKQLFVPSKQT